MGSVTTSLGRIGVAEQGGGSALPIVFLHGVGSDKKVWTPQLDHFGPTRRALAFDYPGYGESDPAPDDCSRDDFAAAVLEAMGALGVESAHVCGLSLGGIVAIAMHAAAPQRCASLVLADSFAAHPEGETIYKRSVQGSGDAGMRALAEQRAPLLLAPDTAEAVRRDVIDTMAAIDPSAYRIGARAVWLANQRERAAGIRRPTLVLVGELDPVTPPSLSEELSALIPGSAIRVIAGASHISNLDQSQEFNCYVEEFLAEVEAKA